MTHMAMVEVDGNAATCGEQGADDQYSAAPAS
jgi:hypothetical protein